jgi:ATP-dependent DNA helicase RecQ
LRDVLEGIPVLALTATATPEVCEDIQEKLSFSGKNLLRKSFDRENLTYVVRKTEDKVKELREMVQKLEGSGIIYARNRKKCREVAQMLREEGISADFYHAGVKHHIRDERQQLWTGNQFRVMVATNAFGMGIDKPDVRFVIHLDLPDSPEAYFQEAGRAGRDENKAWAILLYTPSDDRMIQQRIEMNFPGIPKIREIYMALCNYLQIPLGSGKGQSYDFELGEFLHRYRINAMLAHSALSILSREGYLALTEAFHNPSRITFRMGRDDLYHFQVKHADFDSFIKLLLRTYSGLFTQYVKIDESSLARRSGLSPQKVLSYLNTLSTRQVIQYIPRKEVPVITLLEERLDEKNLLIAPERYRFRQERYEKRIREMLRYASSETFCRNQFLLSYFGQLDTPRCGRCDVCLKSEQIRPDEETWDHIRDWVSDQLHEHSLSIEELVTGFSGDQDLMIQVVEQLLEEGVVIRGKDLKLTWK